MQSFATSILAALTLFSAIPLRAMLTHGHAVLLPGGKRVTLFSDRHGTRPESSEQLTSVTQLLATYTQQTPNKLLVLIEQVSQLYYEITKRKNVLSHLSQEITQHKLENICTERCGMPEEALQSVYLLGAQTPSVVAKLLSLEHIIKELSFKKLLSVFKTEHSDIQTLIKTINHTRLQNSIQKHLITALAYKIKLKNILKEHGIATTDLIAQTYSKKTPEVRDTCSTTIINAFSPLFELKYLCKILQAPQKEIVVLAGYKHINAIHSLLLDYNPTQLCSIGSFQANAPGLTTTQLQQVLSASGYSMKNFKTYSFLAGWFVISMLVLTEIIYQFVIDQYPLFY